MDQFAKPIPNSYWVVPGHFLAGEHPAVRDQNQARQRMAAFLQCGIDTFIDLTVEGERPAYKSLLEAESRRSKRKSQYQRFPFPDFGVPSALLMITVLNTIDKALAGDHEV